MFDDVLDLIDTALAADTYDNVGRPLLRAGQLVANAGIGQIAKGLGPIGWGFRGADYLADRSGVELPEGIREQLRAEAAQARSGAFTGDLITDQGADQGGAAGARARDDGPRSATGDVFITRTFDP